MGLYSASGNGSLAASGRPSRADCGFTLVELMVVVLIIGILVAIAIPVFGGAIGNARINACRGSMRSVESAIQAYNSQHVSTPIEPLSGTSYAQAIAALVPGLVKAAPGCPSGGTYSFGTVDGAVLCSVHGPVQ